MNITTCMKRNVVSIPASTTVGEAAARMVEKHVGILPVVDEKAKPIGVIRLSDLLSLELPDFINLVEDIDFVHDFGAVETTRPDPDLLAQPVTTLMESVDTIEEESGLLRAYAIMLQGDLYDLPVINAAGELVGVVSRVDIGTSVLSLWTGRSKR
jgi:CBS-domain-containing membrane protein